MGGSLWFCDEKTTLTTFDENIGNKFKQINNYNIFGFHVNEFLKSSKNNETIKLYSVSIYGRYYWNDIETISGITINEGFIFLDELKKSYEEIKNLVEKIKTQNLTEFSRDRIDYIMDNLNEVDETTIHNLMKYNKIIENTDFTLEDIKDCILYNIKQIGFNEIVGFMEIFKICCDNNIIIKIW